MDGQERPFVAPPRKTYLDILRVIGMLAVVMIHACSQNQAILPLGSGAWLAHTVYDSLARFCVPLFFMISGALFLDPARELAYGRLLKRNALRILTAYLFWSTVYLWLSGTFQPRGGVLSTLVGFVLAVAGGTDHLWFLVALLALYLLMPFLRRIAADRRLLTYFLLLWLLFGVCLRTVRELDVLGLTFNELFDNANLYFVWGYTGCFLLGYYLYSAALTRTARVLLCIGAFAGFAATCLLTCLAARGGVRTHFWFDYLRPNVILQAAGIFAAGRWLWEARSFSERSVRLWAALGKWSFGVYLGHVAVLWLLRAYLGLSSVSFAPWLSIPLVTLLACALSFGVSALINKLPFVGRWLV